MGRECGGRWLQLRMGAAVLSAQHVCLCTARQVRQAVLWAVRWSSVHRSSTWASSSPEEALLGAEWCCSWLATRSPGLRRGEPLLEYLCSQDCSGVKGGLLIGLLWERCSWGDRGP